jgi:DNA-binding NtrC family response regulator
MSDQRHKHPDGQETVTIDDLPSGRPPLTVLLFHRQGVEVAQLVPGSGLVVGRTAPADLVVADPSLSRRHALLEVLDDDLFVEDLGSKNGTRVNGARIERSLVRPGDTVQLGSVTLSLHRAPVDAPPVQGLRDHDALLVDLERAVVRCRLYRRELALLLVRALDPARGPFARWYLPVRRLCRPEDRLALYDPGTLEILLPAAGADDAAHHAERIIQAGLEVGTPLCCGLALFPAAASSAEELLEACREALARADLDRPVCAAPDEDREQRPDQDPVVLGPKMRSVFETVARLARSSIPVLIQGETGTGKEVVARAIHRAGPRRDLPLRCVNCGAIPRHLVESTLFGHERGAFTGAEQQHRGIFEQAHGGTVLLDEIAELPGEAQAALLRVLEDRRVTRIGGSGEEIAVDVRVIAATNRDLETLCDEGDFRQDLLFRLNTITLDLPPLRERGEEIPALVEHFLWRARRDQRSAVQRIAPEALELLQRYPWPGNVRELRNVIERATVLCQGDTIVADDLSERVRAASDPAAARDDALDFRSRIQRYEAELVLEALRASGWNQSEAARRLNMPLRTMVRKIRAYGFKGDRER